MNAATAQQNTLGTQYLAQARAYLAGATAGLSDAQWTFKPAADRWSIAEIVEHMVLVEGFILGPLQEQLSPSSADADPQMIDTIVVRQLPDRTAKFPAPEVLAPTGRWAPREALARFLEAYDRLAAQAESNEALLRQRYAPAPPLRAVTKGAHEFMDGYQWILANGAHTERHTKQILEVKADAGFPVN
jgi:hypothetical protein